MQQPTTHGLRDTGDEETTMTDVICVIFIDVSLRNDSLILIKKVDHLHVPVISILFVQVVEKLPEDY